MARPQLYTNEQIKEALEKANGQVYVAARFLKCSYQVFYSRFRQFPELREYAQGFKEVITDQVEQVLIEKALVTKEPWAVTFWLKTQAKHRGYTERQEFSGPEGKPIEFNWHATVTEIETGSVEDIDSSGTNPSS
jgi:hypothetical protein